MSSTKCITDRGGHPSCLAGFTLIEIMIVLVIVAILATIAYPSYLRFITTGNRDEARSNLQQIQILQENHRRAAGEFDDGTALAAALANMERAEFYEYEITAGGRTGFTARANAVGRQATRETSLLGGVCNQITMQVNLAGVTRTPQECW